MPARRALALGFGTLLALAACKREAIEVRQEGAADYNRKALLAAIDRYTEAGQTAAAYGQLALDIGALRTGMDETVAAEAELQLVVLALAPVDAVKGQPIEARAAALATTVWSAALDGSVEAPDPQLGPRRPGDPAKPGEPVAAYVTRLCGGPLAVSCMMIVPEAQAELVEAEAVRRFARRAKHAVSACAHCSSERAWQQAVERWGSSSAPPAPPPPRRSAGRRRADGRSRARLRRRGRRRRASTSPTTAAGCSMACRSRPTRPGARCPDPGHHPACSRSTSRPARAPTSSRR